MLKSGMLLAVLTLSACAKPTHDVAKPVVTTQDYTFNCNAMVDARLAVFPTGNKSGQDVRLDGMDDILISELTRSKCFQGIERDKDKMAVLFAEIDKCAPDAKDRERYDCSTFAKTGKQLGVTHYIFSDIILVAPKVAAAELEAKFPTIGTLSANEEYAAVVMTVRAVDVATGAVAGSATVHALVPSVKAGIDLGMKGASLKAATQSTTPMGAAIMQMLSKSVDDMHASWRATAGNGSASGAAAGTTP